MDTLILRSPGVVNNSEDFKRIGHSNIGYTANLGAINPSQPALFGFNMEVSESPITVTIEGATIYRISGGVIDFANPTDGVMTWDQDQTGGFVGIAFVPTKEKGYVRISSKGSTIRQFLGAYTANDAIQIEIEPSELKNYQLFVYDFAVPAGYVPKFKLTGDINGFSNSTKTETFDISASIQLSQDFNKSYWDKPLADTFQNISLLNSPLNADIDLSIFDNCTPAEIRIFSNLGLRFFGSINHCLASVPTLIILSNYSEEGITGSLGSIATNFTAINIHAPNLAGGYTTRTFTMSFVNLKINAPKIAATQWDLLLSDLANSASITGGVVQVNKRTAASDAAVTTLTNKGVTVIIGF